ncbi:MAG: PilT/PilU family type 4a pilus ATPase [Polyangiaceae bacterium]|nr:PilT/PilU family type 4a pilus ATPase [Polyangiaceae bacterium]
MLSAVGGGRHLDALDAQPTQWSVKLAGLGSVVAVASLRDGAIYARFAVSRPAAGPKRPASLRPRRPSVPPSDPADPTHTTPARPRASDHAEAAPERPRRASDHAQHAHARPRASAHAEAAPERPRRASDHAQHAHARPRASAHAEAAPERPRRASGHALHAAARSAPASAPPGGLRRPPEPAPGPATRPPPRRASQPPESGRAHRHGHGHGQPVHSSPAQPDDEAFQLDVESPAAPARAHAASAPTRVRVSGGVAADVPAPDRAVPSLDAQLERILAQACRAHASDVHLVAGRPLLLRVGGELGPSGAPLEPSAVEQLVERTVPERVRAALARDGSCDFALAHPGLGRFRANAARHQGGYKLCLRVVPAEVPTLASLGLPGAIADATRHHQGLILVTGPTGHGKTSTLAAIVDIINRDTTHHVITVEDPIEYLHPRKQALMSQREVGRHTRSFASALKASLREDPDVIVVGELRDTETVRMALSASETGHLVLGTMNTPSAAKTIDRLIDLFPPADEGQVRMTLAGGLRLIVSQRLVPTTKGGLAVAAELLPGSVPLWNLIRDSRTFQIPSLQQRGKALGIVRLDDSLAELVRAGTCTLAAAKAFAEAADFAV